MMVLADTTTPGWIIPTISAIGVVAGVVISSLFGLYTSRASRKAAEKTAQIESAKAAQTASTSASVEEKKVGSADWQAFTKELREGFTEQINALGLRVSALEVQVMHKDTIIRSFGRYVRVLWAAWPNAAIQIPKPPADIAAEI